METDGILNIGVAPRTAQINYILVKQRRIVNQKKKKKKKKKKMKRGRLQIWHPETTRPPKSP